MLNVRSYHTLLAPFTFVVIFLLQKEQPFIYFINLLTDLHVCMFGFDGLP